MYWRTSDKTCFYTLEYPLFSSYFFARISGLQTSYYDGDERDWRNGDRAGGKEKGGREGADNILLASHTCLVRGCSHFHVRLGNFGGPWEGIFPDSLEKRWQFWPNSAQMCKNCHSSSKNGPDSDRAAVALLTVFYLSLYMLDVVRRSKSFSFSLACSRRFFWRIVC